MNVVAPFHRLDPAELKEKKEKARSIGILFLATMMRAALFWPILPTMME
jgi:hypothetical protein